MQRSFVDFENETIQKQREELQQLIAELRDRECELSEMARTHQRHMDAWQRDRRRATSLEDKCSQLQSQSLRLIPPSRYTSVLLYDIKYKVCAQKLAKTSE